MIGTIAACLVSAPAVIPQFHRQWTLETGDGTKILAVEGNRALFASSQRVGAVDLNSGRFAWQRSLGFVATTRLSGHRLYVIESFHRQARRLLVLDPKSGAILRTGKLPPEVRWQVYGDDLITVTRDQIQRVGFDGTIKWSGSAHLYPEVQSVEVLSPSIFLDTKVGTAVVDGRNGKLLRRIGSSAALYGLRTMGNEVVIRTGGSTSIALDSTGKQLWKLEQPWFPETKVQNTLIGQTDEEWLAVDAKSGRVAWKTPRGRVYPRVLVGLATPLESWNAVALRTNAGYRILSASSGKDLANRKYLFDGVAISFRQKSLFAHDHCRILGYRVGSPAPAPTELRARRSFALRQVAQFEKLDRQERAQLATLGKFAARPLLARFGRKDFRSEDLYVGYHCVMALERMLQPSDTAALIKWIEETRMPELYDLLGKTGDPRQYVPYLLKKANEDNSYSARGANRISALSWAKHPDAVSFFLEALKSKDHRDSRRETAYLCLPRIGGEAGARAVLAERRAHQSLRPWPLRVADSFQEVDAKESEQLDGRSFNSAVLGEMSDLFTQDRVDGKWSTPKWMEPDRRDHDSDGDGVPDLVEARLGTDAKRADSDGDGTPDGIDPCPMVRPRQLGDREKIAQACVDALFYNQGPQAPARLSVPRMQPFELVGYDGWLLWTTEDSDRRVGDFIRIRLTRPDDPHSDTGDPIRFSRDRKHARVALSWSQSYEFGAGYVAELLKRGDEWFVVRLERVWIS